MKMIKLHYEKDGKEVTINPKYIVAYEQYTTLNKTYTEVLTLIDECFDVKETPAQIDQMLEGPSSTQPYTYITEVTTNAPESNKDNSGTFLKPKHKWYSKPKKNRSRKLKGL